jgi:hypothetical protein
MKIISTKISKKLFTLTFLSIFVLVNLASCSLINLPGSGKQTIPDLSQAEVGFQAILPSALPENASLVLEIEDDVTGIAFNPTRYVMDKQDDRTYFVKVNLVIGGVVKYRYIRQDNDNNTVEFTPQGTQIRYRMANITGPGILQDNISGWIDAQYSGAIGRVRGQFIDQATNSPIPNLLVIAEGIQTVTSSDGSFLLEGLTPGTHNLVAYSMDGQYNIFSQGVTIAEEATTPVYVSLNKRKTVDITFNITIPDGYNEQLPLRFASNLQSLGNIYADIYAGSTTVAANLPQLTRISKNHYQYKTTLPVGFDLQYKYTFGDGLWNSEVNSTGNFALRELVIPDHATTINDIVSSFTTPGFAPVSFVVNSSVAIPSDETISIQFNPFGWFESIPMTKLGDSQWVYTLYSPLSIFGDIEYRFCRNDLCEYTQGVAKEDQKFAAGQQAQTFSQTVDEWTNYAVASAATEVITYGGNITPRTDFAAGFETTNRYLPTWPAYLNSGLQKIAATGANYVVFSPTWSATRNSPPYLEPLPGVDISWTEMQTSILQAGQNNLNAAIFPRVNFPNSAAGYWSAAKRDEGWWNSWYDCYHRYIMQVADWASLTGAKTIILGDPELSPSMQNGTLADGTASASPSDSDDQWRQLVKDVRSHFSGTILGAVAYPSSSSVPGWLDSVDGIYLLYSAPLAQVSNASVADLETILQSDLEQNVYPSLSSLSKPVWLAVNYPSATNANAGCTDKLGSCLDNWADGQTDMTTQAQIYNAAVIVAAKENWINGFIARGNQPLAVVLDSSPSVLSKPANDVLWFWYHFILNKSA